MSECFHKILTLTKAEIRSPFLVLSHLPDLVELLNMKNYNYFHENL